MIRIAFCDDNVQYINLLSDYVKKECDKILCDLEDFIIAPPFNKGQFLLEYIKNNPIDILFLDIDMPEIDGFEVAKILSQQYPEVKIVFISAYDNFVYNAFQFYPVAYLRKEHILEDLPKVLKRLIDKIHEPNRQIQLITTLGNKIIDTNSITYIESSHNYYITHLIYGEQYCCRGTLSEIENILPSVNFFRIHSAYIINFDYIDRVLEKNYVIVNNVKLSIAQRRVMKFKNLYMDYIRGKLET